jgi:5-oxopent-3-ene-1,2,5-tricarboxylate decarboxylase/2-hydroxyhepta-2,4-diene-1,7-dioate isomerase
VPENAPRARVGDRVRIEIDGVGALENVLVAEVRL